MKTDRRFERLDSWVWFGRAVMTVAGKAECRASERGGANPKDDL